MVSLGGGGGGCENLLHTLIGIVKSNDKVEGRKGGWGGLSSGLLERLPIKPWIFASRLSRNNGRASLSARSFATREISARHLLRSLLVYTFRSFPMPPLSLPVHTLVLLYTSHTPTHLQETFLYRDTTWKTHPQGRHRLRQTHAFPLCTFLGTTGCRKITRTNWTFFYK